MSTNRMFPGFGERIAVADYFISSIKKNSGKTLLYGRIEKITKIYIFFTH